MSLALTNQISGLRICSKRVGISVTSLNNFDQVRTATKKVSGSKTNKNDSAGRRLGPKAYEGHLVNTGQIIMRQRGTKIHPGENVGIGSDHTIFALEPGYVRFYYDPFHPLRKYVGVALKKELTLPTPHFSPRVRRFGYEPITEQESARKEEQHMSRKEYSIYETLVEEKRQKDLQKAKTIEQYQLDINKFQIEYNDSELALIIDRLYEVQQLRNTGQTLSEAKTQATFNYLYDLKLSAQTGKITNDELTQMKTNYNTIVLKVDHVIDIDAQGNLCNHIDDKTMQIKQTEIKTSLESKFANKLLSNKDREEILSLIQTPGVFDITAQDKLTLKYLPKITPYDIPGSVIEITDAEKPPKGVVVQRVFDAERRKTKVIGRPKEAV